MNTAVNSDPSLKRTLRLKQDTDSVHEQLDRRIMEGKPFHDRERYGRFVAVQYYFHRDMDPLYNSAALKELLPDLAEGRRLALIEQDLRDLGLTVPPGLISQLSFSDPLDVPAALGWLYVSEGSNLGAAILGKQAEKLGMSEQFGARHLSAHAESRGTCWRRFTSALDAMQLSAAEDLCVIDGAHAAFHRVRSLADMLLL